MKLFYLLGMCMCELSCAEIAVSTCLIKTVRNPCSKCKVHPFSMPDNVNMTWTWDWLRYDYVLNLWSYLKIRNK
jgi:hypothetical protein